jgi:hypothetical protein
MRHRLALIIALIALVFVLVPTIRAASPPRDRTAPTKPTVDVGPTDDLRPVFHFGARDNRTPSTRLRFRCALDGALLHLCGRIYQVIDALSFGKHELRAVAVDSAGNVSRVATAPFTVVGTWDATSDFPVLAPSENPAHDKYGNTVWSYLYSGAPLYHTTLYPPPSPLSILNPGWQEWDLGLRSDGSIVTPLVGWNNNRMIFAPSRDRFAVLGWRSPYAGQVSIELELLFPEPLVQAGSNGVVWSLDRGNAQLQTAVLTPTDPSARAQLTTQVAVGDIFYVTIDNRGDSNWDTIVGQFRVRTLFP